MGWGSLKAGAIKPAPKAAHKLRKGAPNETFASDRNVMPTIAGPKPKYSWGATVLHDAGKDPSAVPKKTGWCAAKSNASTLLKAEAARRVDAAYMASVAPRCPPSQILDAVHSGDLAQVQQLTTGPNELNVEVNGLYPLYAAVCQRNVPIATWLLQQGASIDARPKGYNPAALYESVRRGDLEMAELLLSFGADVSLVDDPVNRRTALHAAVEAADEAMVAMLLEYGARPRQKDMEGRSVLDMVQQMPGTLIAELVKGSKNTWNSLLSCQHGPQVQALRQRATMRGNLGGRQVTYRAGQPVTQLRHLESIGQVDQRTMDRVVGPRASDTYGQSLLKAAAVIL